MWDSFKYSYNVVDYGYYEVLTVSKVVSGSGKGYDVDMVGDRFRQSLSRAKRNIREILQLNLVPNGVMVTLTYEKNMQDYRLSNNHFKWFIKSLNSPKYLRIMELQKRGAIHYHVILFDYRSEKEVINAWSVKGKLRGFIYHKEIIDIAGVDSITNYLAKYVSNTNKGQMIDNGYRLYTTSKDVKRYKRRKGNATDLLRFKQGLSVSKDGYIKYILPK